MSYKSQKSGAQIDAAVEGIRAVVQKLSDWKNIIFSIGYTTPPPFAHENKVWTRRGTPSRFEANCTFDEDNPFIINRGEFPYVFFYKEETEGRYYRVNYDYSLYTDTMLGVDVITGFKVYSNIDSPVIAICTNGGGLAEDSGGESKSIADFILPWSEDIEYPNNVIVAYLDGTTKKWYKSTKDNNLDVPPTNWQLLGTFFDDQAVEYTTNKVSVIDNSEIHYPSTKAVNDEKEALQAEIERLKEENRNQAFQIADLKNIAYDTIVDELPNTFLDLTQENHPTHIADESGQYHPVLPDGECEFVEMMGKSVVSENLFSINTREPKSVTFGVDAASYSTKNVNEFLGTPLRVEAGTYTVVYEYPSGNRPNALAFVENNGTTIFQINVGEGSTSTLGDGYIRLCKTFTIGSPAILVRYWVQKGNYVGSITYTTRRVQVLKGTVSINDIPGYAPHFDGIKSVLTEGLQINGQNLWDEEWEVGSISTATGEPEASTTTIRSKNLIRVTGNKNYRLSASTYGNFYWYDKDEKFIKADTTITSYGTAPQNAKFLKFRMSSGYGTTYNNNIAIILGTQGSYTPYKTPQLVSFGESIELPSAKSVKSIISLVANDDATYRIILKKLPIVDLGSYEWSEGSSSSITNKFFTAAIPQLKHGGWSVIPNILCAKYTTSYALANKNKTIFTTASGVVGIIDNDYTDASLFKNSLSGVMMVYEPTRIEEIILADNLTENQVATLIEKYGSVEVVGNTNEEFVKPDVTMLYQVTKAIES